MTLLILSPILSVRSDKISRVVSIMDEELLDFNEIERNRYESMNFAKRVVLSSFTEILSQRRLLPNDAFKAVRVKGVQLFVFNADQDDAYENLVKLSKICDDIDNEAVKTLRFLVNLSEDGKERVGEVYEIGLTYGENITVTFKLGDSTAHVRYDARTRKRDFKVFIMRLRHFCRMLGDLPQGSYGRYHVVYNNGKKMEESCCEYFAKVVRAPLAWNGPKQEICAIVGTLNKKEIGIKMSVGTLFGTGETDAMALEEHFKDKNWNDGGWDEHRENKRRRFEDQEDITKTVHVSYHHTKLEMEEGVLIRGRKGGKPVDETTSSDTARRGSDIDSSTVLALTEEANEKEGRMEKRRRRKKAMMERMAGKNTKLAESRCELQLRHVDFSKKMEKTPGDAKSTTTSSESVVKTPGICTKRSIISKQWHIPA